MENSIKAIKVYQWNGLWVFDDESVGLNKEPFVSGADTLLDKLANGKNTVILIFSDNPFPDYNLAVELVDSTPGGSNYYCKEMNHKLWLCPALFKYFPVTPKIIYLKYKN